MVTRAKRILLIGYNFSPEPTGIGRYSGEMIDWFVQEGYDCSVITAYPYYPYWEVQEPYVKRRFKFTKERTDHPSGGSVTTYRCPMYVPENPSGIKRILVDVSFFITAFLQLSLLLFRKKFQLIITVAPCFQLGLLGVYYKKLRGGKLVYHIQDLQIEAAQDLGMIRSPSIIKSLLKVEKYIFNKTDVISSISEGMVSKIKQKAEKEVYFFPNWTNTAFFYPFSESEIHKIKNNYGFETHDKIILYSGAIGEKQGLEMILSTAKTVQSNPDIKFIICGTGPYRLRLQEMTIRENITNVYFFPLQPLEKFNAFLNIADVHLVIQKAKAGDLVMPSKLTNILSVGGLALITANIGTGLYNVVTNHQMGIVVEPENPIAFRDGLLNAIQKKNQQLKGNALHYAQNFLAINTIMKRFERTQLDQL